MLSPTEIDFIFAALAAAVDEPRQAIEQAGGEVEVVTTTGLNATGNVPVPSEDEGGQEEADS